MIRSMMASALLAPTAMAMVAAPVPAAVAVPLDGQAGGLGVSVEDALPACRMVTVSRRCAS